MERQQEEASNLAETLYRRVMALEKVAFLDGVPLKEGLKREAGALARELSGWMGRAGSKLSDAYNHRGKHNFYVEH